MIKPNPIEETKSKKVMMLWEPSLHKKVKSFAKKNNMTISELSRIALNKVIDESGNE